MNRTLEIVLVAVLLVAATIVFVYGTFFYVNPNPPPPEEPLWLRPVAFFLAVVCHVLFARWLERRIEEYAGLKKKPVPPVTPTVRLTTINVYLNCCCIIMVKVFFIIGYTVCASGLAMLVTYSSTASAVTFGRLFLFSNLTLSGLQVIWICNQEIQRMEFEEPLVVVVPPENESPG
jgi:hypothetical protein